MTSRKTKIVCTIGPATESPEGVEALVVAGMDVARLNFSHGTHDDHKRRFDLVRKFAAKHGRNVAVLMDVRGPKMRVGVFNGGFMQLAEKTCVRLTEAKVAGDNGLIPVDQSGFISKLSKGNSIFLDDGALELQVDKVGASEAECTVIVGGRLKDRKGIAVPGVVFDLPSITDKDHVDIKFIASLNPEYVAQSFVKSAADVKAFRKLLEKGGCDAGIITKIEEPSGLRNIDEIIEEADGVMVARGDLGVQIPFEDVPLVQKQLVMKCHRANKPIIVATQMLESMTQSPQPTRAEVTDVANAILDGADAVMLSAETASGAYPFRAVETMDRIARKTEETLMVYDRVEKTREKLTPQEAIGKSVVYTSRDLQARAIITYTQSGHTARYIASYRPSVPIIAASPNARDLAKLALLWGVRTELVKQPETTEELVEASVKAAVKHKLVEKGDVVVITAGMPLAIAGNTNFLKIHVV